MVVPTWQVEILYIGNGWDWGVPSISFWLGLGFQVAIDHSQHHRLQSPDRVPARSPSVLRRGTAEPKQARLCDGKEEPKVVWSTTLGSENTHANEASDLVGKELACVEALDSRRRPRRALRSAVFRLPFVATRSSPDSLHSVRLGVLRSETPAESKKTKPGADIDAPVERETSTQTGAEDVDVGLNQRLPLQVEFSDRRTQVKDLRD